MTPAEEHAAKIERQMQRLHQQPEIISYLLAQYQLATIPPESEPTPEEIAAKWAANGIIVAWLRASMPQILELWAAANAWALNPGGRANQRVIRAVKKMPLCECGGGK